MSDKEELVKLNQETNIACREQIKGKETSSQIINIKGLRTRPPFSGSSWGTVGMLKNLKVFYNKGFLHRVHWLLYIVNGRMFRIKERGTT